MKTLTEYFETDFNSQRDQWEKTLTSELKLAVPGEKVFKKAVTGAQWSTLSLAGEKSSQLSSSEWKKSSNTYVSSVKESFLIEDLDNGVRCFFFHEQCLSQGQWESIEKIILAHPDARDVEVFVSPESEVSSSRIKIIRNLITGKEFQEKGGHSAQELGLMAKHLAQNCPESEEVYLGVYVDSLFFNNIAKLRAARLLGEKILQENGLKKELKIVALTSFEDWTLYERYTNMLRNEVAVASGHIGGADYVQSSGYNSLLEIETSCKDEEHIARSLRMARNTSHILSLESMLGIVQDAGSGSYHLEALTDHLCQESWLVMQKLLSGENLEEEVIQVRDEKLFKMETRKTVVSGVNDFPDMNERLATELKSVDFFRRSRPFEKLRLRLEKVSRPRVFIALYGDYGALNLRLNFVKNYFELLGLEVSEEIHSSGNVEQLRKSLSTRKEEIIILCSSDEGYSELSNMLEVVHSRHRYVAGKFELTGFQNLYLGQNIFKTLEEVVKATEESAQ